MKHLKRASYVFLTKSNGRRDTELEALIQQHNPGVDVIECAHRPKYLKLLGGPDSAGGGAEVPLAWLKGRKVVAFSGIATPESFEKFLRDLGALIMARERFLDHYRYQADDLDNLFALAQRQGAECLVTTEKDAVRIEAIKHFPVPVYYLRLEIEIVQGAANFDEAVGRICFPRDAAQATA